MYGLYKIGHILFMLVLFSSSIMLFILSIKTIGGVNKQSRNILLIIAASVVCVFSVIILTTAKVQFIEDQRLNKMRRIYDSREWTQNKKGNIYDRSGSIDRAFAVSVKTDNSSFIRVYPSGESSGHIIGYANRMRGKAGIEDIFSRVLTGMARGNIETWPAHYVNKISSPELLVKDVYLTLDKRIQDAAYKALDGRKGAIAAIDPFTGEVLALVSSPGFSPEETYYNDKWTELTYDTDNSPLFNRAINGLYPPGSVFKIITAAAAIENKFEPEYYSGPDGFRPVRASKIIHEHEYNEFRKKGEKWKGHGNISMKEAFSKSSNVYFSKLSSELGADKIYKMANKFGFNNHLTWNTSSESLKLKLNLKAGKFPGLDNFTEEELCWSAIGQYNVLVSPLHLVLITSVIANGGNMIIPSIELGRYPKINNRVIKVETAHKLKIMMRDVVKEGTGYRANLKGLEVAGKTGTAEINSGSSHSIFVSFAPVDDPKIAMAVIVENGGYGGDSATRIAADLYRAAYKLGYFK